MTPFDRAVVVFLIFGAYYCVWLLDNKVSRWRREDRAMMDRAFLAWKMSVRRGKKEADDDA